jgi:5-methylcytosine-specific restriction protein A
MRTAAQQRADAMTDICRFFLDNQKTRSGGRHRPHLNVVIDEHGGRLIDGPRLTSTAVDALLCDSALHRLVMESRSAVLDYGVSTRTIAAPLWNALVVRDEHCRYPGCDRPATWCDAHHAVPFPDGPTSADNLVLMCRRHHQMLHRPGWHAKLRPDGTLHVTTSWGLVRESRPPGSLPLLS